MERTILNNQYLECDIKIVWAHLESVGRMKL